MTEARWRTADPNRRKFGAIAPNGRLSGGILSFVLTLRSGLSTPGTYFMDIGIIAAIAMLVVWSIGTFIYEAPGYIHLLLTVGVFLIIWRVVVIGRNKPRAS